MSLVVIRTDERRTKEILRSLSDLPKKANTAMARALNTSAMAARTEIVRKTRERFAIQAARARGTIRIHKAKPSAEQPMASVSSVERRQPMTRFKVTPKGPKSWQGVPNTQRRPYVKTWISKGKSTLWRHYFLARFSTGHLGLMRRMGKEKTENGKIKLEEKFGPAVPQMLGGRTGAEAVAEKAERKFYAELDRQVDFLLKR